MLHLATASVLLTGSVGESPGAASEQTLEDVLRLARAALRVDAHEALPRGWVLDGERVELAEPKGSGDPATREHVVLRATADGRFQLDAADAASEPSGRSIGFDGTTLWTRGQGELDVVCGHARERSIASFWLVLGLWTRPELFELELVRLDGAGAELRYRRRRGFAAGRIELSLPDGLPTRITMDGAEESVLDLAGFQAGGGVRLPGSVARHTGGRHESTYTFSAPAPADASSPPPGEPPAGTPQVRFDAERSATVRSLRSEPDGLVYLWAELGDVSGFFLLDSGLGGEVCMLDSAVADRLALAVVGEGEHRGVSGASTRAEIVRPDRIRIGPMTWERPVFGTVDFGEFGGLFGDEVIGILAEPFFARCVVELQARAGVVALHDPSRPPTPAGGWVRGVAIGRPMIVRALVEGRPALLSIDTGSSSAVTLKTSYVERHDLLAGRVTTPGVSRGAYGVIANQTGLLRSFEIGGHRLADLPAQFYTGHSPWTARTDTAGLVGARVLERFTTYLDCGRQRFALVRR